MLLEFEYQTQHLIDNKTYLKMYEKMHTSMVFIILTSIQY